LDPADGCGGALDDRETMMSRQRVLPMLLAAALASLTGCNANVDGSGGQMSTGQEPRLLRQPRPYIPDLPVPVNFKLDEANSGNLDAPGMRLVDHLYKGREDKISVRLFYIREMPALQWRLVTTLFSQGTVVMNFEKKSERCYIEVLDGSWWHPTYIRVRIYTVRTPRGAGTPGGLAGQKE